MKSAEGRNPGQTFLALFSLVTGLIILTKPGIAAMSITGTTGLVDIPTAHIIPDGKIAFGIGYTNKKYSLYSPKYAQVTYYVTIGYLPFLEMGLRITHFPGKMEPGVYGSTKDRMASVKLRVIKEGRYLPSMLLGARDIIGGSTRFNAAYIVMSKCVHLLLLGSLDIHLGYASDILMKEADHHSMLGPFAGLEKKLCRYLTVMGEYDTRKCSLGLRIMPWGDRTNIDLVALGLKRISGGMSISFGL